MVFEQMLTIFFATGVGVAIVLYSARSRRSVAPSLIGQSAAVQTFAATEAIHADVTDAPVVDASSVFESQVVSDIPSATSEVATPTEAAAVAAPAEVAPIVEPTVMMESQASAAVEAPAHTAERSHRVHSSRRRSSGTASSRTRVRPSQRSRKR